MTALLQAPSAERRATLNLRIRIFAAATITSGETTPASEARIDAEHEGACCANCQAEAKPAPVTLTLGTKPVDR